MHDEQVPRVVEISISCRLESFINFPQICVGIEPAVADEQVASVSSRVHDDRLLQKPLPRHSTVCAGVMEMYMYVRVREHVYVHIHVYVSVIRKRTYMYVFTDVNIIDLNRLNC